VLVPGRPARGHVEAPYDLGARQKGGLRAHLAQNFIIVGFLTKIGFTFAPAPPSSSSTDGYQGASGV
jgi:hypothetical protein